MAFSVWVQQDAVMSCEAQEIIGFLCLVQRTDGEWQLVCPKTYTAEQVTAVVNALHESLQKGASDAGADPDREQAEPR
jgi:hypothetical protein